MNGECAADGCTREARSIAGSDRVCLMHYKRWKRHGDFTVQGRAWSAPNPNKRECLAGGCRALEDGASGYCKMHGSRVRRHGDPAVVIKPAERATVRGEDHPAWSGEAVSYGGAHMRVRAANGNARDQRCVDCGARAAQWAYTHDDPNELRSPVGPYSADPAFYVPKCVSCHKRADLRRLK